MTEHLLPSSGPYQRKAWLLDAPEADGTRCAIFLDGEFYVNRMGTPALLRDMQAKGNLPSMPCLFVSYVHTAARHRDLTGNPDYAAFIATEVVGWLRDRMPTLGAGDHVIAGPSLGGLAAAFITLRHPQVFSRCLSQSGSFWWEDERMAAMLPEMPFSCSRFWISVGDRETSAGLRHEPGGLHQKISQIDGCRRFADALLADGHEVHYSVHEGAHELHPWADELPHALPWLLKTNAE